jgi:hypothetical protein
MNGLMLIATAKSRSACNSLYAARYPCVYNAQNVCCPATAAPQNVIAKLWRYPHQVCFRPQSTAAIPYATTHTTLARVENT